MKVSVVVPNHGRDISILRKSLMESTHSDWELNVIDMGKERSYQRNVGIKNSTGEYILILDSDQSVSPKLIEECVEYCERFSVTAMYIPEVIVHNSFFGKVRAFEREFYTETAVDVVRFVKRTSCPLFDEDQHGTEDSDWDRRVVGYRSTSENVLYHHDDIGVVEYFKKKAYYAKSLKMFRDRNPNDMVLDPVYRCFTVFTEDGKWKKMIRHPILTMCIMAMVFVRGVIYYANR